MRVNRRSVAGTGGLLLAAACGGGDGQTGPARVESVVVTLAASQVEVGSNIFASALAKDSRGTAVSGKQFTWQSSAPTVASVDGSGVVTGVSAGTAAIMASVDGVSGSAPVTVVAPGVASVVISPRAPSVREGEQLQLAASTLDALGRPLAGRPLSWSSSSATVATVSGAGLVSGLSPGSAWIVAASEGKRDSVSLRVKSLLAPTVTGTAPALWTPGATVTVNGTNFSPLATGNEVYVNGVPATVAAATPATLTVTLPAVQSLPCRPDGPATVTVVVSGDSAAGTAQLNMATPRSLAVGQSLLMLAQADLLCNQFTVTGGKYLVTAFNHSVTAGQRTSFQLLGATTSSSISEASMSSLPAGSVAVAGPLRSLLANPAATSARAHLAMLEESRQLLDRNPGLARRLRERRSRARPRATGGGETASLALGRGAAASLSSSPVPPPAVGDKMWKRMRRTFSSSSTFDSVRVRVVYVGPKLIILEDTSNVLAGQMDNDYTSVGAEFDANMFAFLANFGDPTAIDSLTDNNGRVIAIFTRKVNQYDLGNGAGLLGFVTSCDFLPRSDPIPSQACASSNEGEYFYAFVPNPGGSSGAYSLDTWRRYLRGTMIHEMKHVVMFATRIKLEADFAEEIWLEEATAQMASELWARSHYGFPQRGNVGWSGGPACDYAPVSATCPDPVEGIGHHFQFLYRYYSSNESTSIIDNTDLVIYGGSWSFARWTTDRYDGNNEGAFLRALVQQRDDRGITNVIGRTGRPWAELLAQFSMASLADDYPGAFITDPRFRLEGWNTRDVFAGMSANLVFRNSDGSTTPAFPLVWPLRVRTVNFGNFPDFVRNVSLLPAGTFAGWEIGGAQSVPQVLAIRSLAGGLPPNSIGMVVLRVQ